MFFCQDKEQSWSRVELVTCVFPHPLRARAIAHKFLRSPYGSQHQAEASSDDGEGLLEVRYEDIERELELAENEK